MAKRGRGTLEDREVSLIKGMMVHKTFAHDQEILALFSRPGRTVNHGRPSEIRNALHGEPMPPASRKFAYQPVASREEVEAFLASGPPVDPRTGLHLEKDELLIEAREAMPAAVRGYTNPNRCFEFELFMVSAVIARTCVLLHYYKNNNVDVVHRNEKGEPLRTPAGAERHLELATLLKKKECPLNQAVKTNLEYIIRLRHEIEHRGTQRIDEAIGAELQACALNFDSFLREQFGPRVGLGRELSLAIRFARIDPMQREGFPRFRMHEHTRLWKEKKAKDASKGFGVEVAGQWYWYENWVDFVRTHCKNAGQRYR